MSHDHDLLTEAIDSLLADLATPQASRRALARRQPDAQAWAAEIAGLAPLSLRSSKRVLNDDGAYEESWPAHKELFDKAWGSQDVIEAQVARIEKRPPNFTGA